MNIIKIVIMIALLTSCAFAQPYQIDWYVIASGGGHVESDNYKLDATIGQPVTGTSSSDSYWLESGYWVGAGPGEGPGGYEYLPADANMFNGAWPPTVIGGDVTYLVNYFRGQPCCPSCILGDFFCAADINGDCNVIGSDVTRLVNYFRGRVAIVYCPDYEPAWPTIDDLSVDAPPGWPNCVSEIQTSKNRVIPGESK